MRPRTLGEILEDAVTMTVRRFVPLSLIVALGSIPGYVSLFLNTFGSGRSHPPSWMLILPGIVTGSWSLMAVAVTVVAERTGETIGCGAAFRAALGRSRTMIVVLIRFTALALAVVAIWSVAFLACVVVWALLNVVIARSFAPAYPTLLTGVGFVVLAVPFAILLFAFYVGVVHAALGPREPSTLVGGITVIRHFNWNVALATLVFLVFAFGPDVGAVALHKAKLLALSVAADMISSIVFGTLIAVFVTLFYLDLEVRHNGSDLASDARAIGTSPLAS